MGGKLKIKQKKMLNMNMNAIMINTYNHRRPTASEAPVGEGDARLVHLDVHTDDATPHNVLCFDNPLIQQSFDSTIL